MRERFERFLKRIGWIEEFSAEFDLPKYEVVEHLKRNTDSGHNFGLFEVFSTSLKPYTGAVYEDGFLFRRRRKLIDFNMGLAEITGTIHQNENKTIINTKVAFPMLIPLAFILIFVIVYGAVSFLLLSGVFGKNTLFMLPLFLLQGFILILIFYVILRQEIRLGKSHFERDLQNFIQKSY